METVSLKLDEIFDLAKKTLLANGCDDDGETPCTFECGDPLASNYDENADYFKDSFNCVYDNYGPILYVSKETGEDPVSSEDLWDGSETYPFKTIQFALDVADDDELIEDNGISLLINKKSFLYLVGTTLEFSDGLNGKGFVFNNPNASRTCGCGESFSL